MSQRTTIVDPLHKTKTKVTKGGALHVTTVPATIDVITNIWGNQSPYQFFTGRLGSDGIDSGIINMNVDGSITPQTFYLGTDVDYDIYISHIVIVVADNTVSHKTFGSLSTLTNGFDLILLEGGVETKLFNKAKTVGELLLQSGLVAAFYAGASMNEVTAFIGNSDADIITFPIAEFVPGGLRLGHGSTNNLRAVVNDVLLGLELFEIRVFGYKSVDITGGV